VRAVLDDAPALQGDDPVGLAHGREAVGDHEHGPPARDLAQVLLDNALAFVVERARGLVENENARIGHQRAGDGDALALPAGEAVAALADDGVVGLGQLENELVRASDLRGRNHAHDRHARIGERDVVAHRAIEEQVLLQHDADLSPQPGGIDEREIGAVDQYAPGLRHVEALDELGKRALARSRRADDTHDLTGGNGEIDIVQHLGGVHAIAEADVLECHLARDRRQRGAARIVGRLGRGIEDVAQPLDRDAGLVEVLPDLSEPEHRRAHPSRQDAEGDELADGEAAVDHQHRADIEDGGVDQLADQLHRLACGIAQADHAKARRHVAGELLFPAALHLRLDRHRLQGLDRGDALDQERLILGTAPEFLVEAVAEDRRRGRRDRDVERQRAEHDEREQRRIQEHHRQEHDGEQEIDHQGERRAGEEIADVLELAHARHRIAHPPRLEIGERQRQ
jgi:hypothetical protein